MRIVISICVILFSSLLSEAQINFKVDSDAERILIGDQFKLTLSVKVESNDEVVWPSIPDSISYGSFIGRSGIDTVTTGDQILLSENWTLTSFDSGFVVIPPVLLIVNGAQYDSDPILIQVDMPKTAGTEYYDIVDPRGLKTPMWKFLVVGVSSLLVILFVVLIIRNISRRSKASYTSIDLRPYHLRIATSLETLRQNVQFKNLEDVDEFYKKGTGLLYNYLRNGLSINIAKGQPSDWVKELSNNAEFKGNASLLVELIEHAQSVRFGHSSASQEDHETWLKEVIAWVQKSKESVQPLKPETVA